MLAFIGNCLFSLLLTSQAELVVYHGVTTQENSTINEVLGLVAVDLDQLTSTRHYLECEKLHHDANELRWEKEGNSSIRFPDTVVDSRRRLDLTPSGLNFINSDDFGMFRCVDTQTQRTVPINITGGPIAITPVIPIHYVYPSNGIYDIRVYVAATPPIQPSEINWLDNDLAQVNDRRRHLYQLLDFGTKLRILNMTTERFGTYYVSVTRDNMLHPVQRIMLMHNNTRPPDVPPTVLPPEPPVNLCA